VINIGFTLSVAYCSVFHCLDGWFCTESYITALCMHGSSYLYECSVGLKSVAESLRTKIQLGAYLGEEFN
jgi:hypothetical protein